ncbi:MAG: PmoA family protein [Lentimonas sp.]
MKLFSRLCLCCLSILHAVHVDVLAAPGPVPDSGSVAIQLDGKTVGYYQSKPMENPLGGDKFGGSNFIHPLKTLSGFVISDFQPSDHKHHFGLWWPWKYVQLGERKILFWELQNGDGIVQSTGITETEDGFIATADYLDRKHPNGPTVILEETTLIETSVSKDAPAFGYFLNMEVTHRVVGEEALTATVYRYSGYSIRATSAWHRDNSVILTSEGAERYTANGSQARWVLSQGDTDTGGKAGFLMMAHSKNRNFPEKIRTWDKWHNGAVFVNFNPVMEKPWVFEPGEEYTRRYSLFIFDGELTIEEAEEIWNQYTQK